MELVYHTLNKLFSILQTVYGWVIWLFLTLLSYFEGHAFVLYLVVSVTLLDALWGILVSVKQGKFTLSELARLTINKMAVYGSALFVFVGLDKFTGGTLTASVVGAAIVLIEFWSMSASMLIINPQMPFLKLMRKVLTGEIATKLNIAPDDVEDILNEIEEKKEKKK